jgi:hypothetical protein
MKQILVFSFGLVTFWSCNKTSSLTPPAPSGQDSLLKSFSLYYPQNHTKSVEIFGYDQTTRLSSIHGYSYDTSGGAPVLDSFLISFTMADTTMPPTSYDIVYHITGAPPAGNADHHVLLYDSQKRVTLDSIASSNVNDQSTQHYIYDGGGNTTIQWLFPDPNAAGGYSINQIDTMLIQNNHISSDLNYTVSNGDDGMGHYVIIAEDLTRLYTRTYSADINPLYNSSLSNSLGCLMAFNGVGDYRSSNLPEQFTDQEAGSPSITLNYVWMTNTSGKVTQGTGVDAGSGLPVEVYGFSY